MEKYIVYRRHDNQLMKSFDRRKDAVFWCKVNQISYLPDGEWEDDYFIQTIDTTTFGESISPTLIRQGARIKAKESIGVVPKDSIGVVLIEGNLVQAVVNWYRPNGEGFIGQLPLNRSDYSKVEVMGDE